jgi:hypothetical protein
VLDPAYRLLVRPSQSPAVLDRTLVLVPVQAYDRAQVHDRARVRAQVLAWQRGQLRDNSIIFLILDQVEALAAPVRSHQQGLGIWRAPSREAWPEELLQNSCAVPALGRPPYPQVGLAPESATALELVIALASEIGRE